MSGKNQVPVTLNWQATDPRIGFLPNPTSSGSIPSGTAGGAMASTNVIYSQIVDVSRMDNIGLELDWTGTPNGTISVLGSVSGASFYPVTPSPTLTQPTGSPSGALTGLNQYQFKYLLIKYTNSSSTGTLTGYLQLKDLN